MQTVCAVVVHFFSYCIDNEIECLPIVSLEAGNNSEYPYSAHLAIKGLPALGRYTLHVSKAQRLGVSIFQMNACTIFQCVRTEGTHNTHTAIIFCEPDFHSKKLPSTSNSIRWQFRTRLKYSSPHDAMTSKV